MERAQRRSSDGIDPAWVFPKNSPIRWTLARRSLTLDSSTDLRRNTMQTATLTIPAMQSEAIAIAVAQALETVAGVETVHITLASARARVGFDEERATPQQLRSAVAAAGFTVDTTPARVGSGCCGGCCG
jgi:copper chaperone CopZ